MVQFGALQIQLVQAINKEPFKEHTSANGDVYVEVEPDVEYFLSVHKTSVTDSHLYVKYQIDDETLDFCSIFPRYLNDEKRFIGLYQEKKGGGSDKALKFVLPPTIERRRSDFDPRELVGSIRIDISEAVVGSVRSHHHDFNENHSEQSVRPKTVTIPAKSPQLKEKVVRSAGGDFRTDPVPVPEKAGVSVRFEPGSPLGSLTLRYCCAKGLLEAGILQSADIWRFLREEKPADPCYELNVQPKRQKIHCENGTVKDVDLFDFSEVPDGTPVLKPKVWCVLRQIDKPNQSDPRATPVTPPFTNTERHA
uniref:Uncharacterized protein n=1 Tax=Entomoneis paludosa TaxID=265537 RepID=A0A7S2YMS5_9STRA|mmetsp:Transcript_39022/g.81003  ORF Transcript_39022/g.81003 Transcript_39022/m.81003 type:complete len:308 (+) Transcript_39022:142-1065(+)